MTTTTSPALAGTYVADREHSSFQAGVSVEDIYGGQRMALDLEATIDRRDFATA
jgi:hypothetical protein